MPLTYRIDADRGLLLVVGHGAITQAQRLETVRAWMADPAFRPGLHTLCDFSATTSAPTMADLMQLIALVREQATAVGSVKLALVTARPVGFGVARQFAAMAEAGPLEVRVFSAVGDAAAWLTEPGGQ